MIKLIKKGQYQMAEAKPSQVKLLILDKKDVFAWPNTIKGELLVTSAKDHTIDCLLSVGEYRLYMVKDEPNLVDLVHLELEIGQNQWQGYLLPTGLPDKIDIRNRIIPTREIVTSK